MDEEFNMLSSLWMGVSIASANLSQKFVAVCEKYEAALADQLDECLFQEEESVEQQNTNVLRIDMNDFSHMDDRESALLSEWVVV